MGLGGVIFASLAILIVTLVANGRWPSVWAAILGNQQPASGAAGVPTYGNPLTGPTQYGDTTTNPNSSVS